MSITLSAGESVRCVSGLFCLSELSGFSIWSGLTSCIRLIHSNKRKEAMFYKAKNALFSAK